VSITAPAKRVEPGPSPTVQCVAVGKLPFLVSGLVLTLALVGCERDADPLLCGDVGAGDLVITEVRGGPTITDVDGQWLEVYNASAGPVDLHGLAITIRSISGQKTDRVLVRRALTVAAGGYAVVGKFDDATRPAHIDVGWGTEPAIPRDGAIALACGDSEIDRIAFTALTDPAQNMDQLPLDPPAAGRGTYALGTAPPSATANDDAGNWCADGTETLGPCNGQNVCLEYYKGSPGEPNPACPP